MIAVIVSCWFNGGSVLCLENLTNVATSCWQTAGADGCL